MPELTVVVRVPLPNQPSLRNLERVIFQALQATGRELVLQAFLMLEEQVAGVVATSSRGSGNCGSPGGGPPPNEATAIPWIRSRGGLCSATPVGRQSYG